MTSQPIPTTKDETIDAILAYERAGEPDGCYYCGNGLHHSSDCHDEEDDEELDDIFLNPDWTLGDDPGER